MHHEENKTNWLEALKRKTQTCPHCGQRWLIIGARNNQKHPCRDCGQYFIIQQSNTMMAQEPRGQQNDTGETGLSRSASVAQTAAVK
ncbi:MAG: hypothetical protein ABI977_35785 [Acidobacteriota bacterium]